MIDAVAVDDNDRNFRPVQVLRKPIFQRAKRRQRRKGILEQGPRGQNQHFPGSFLRGPFAAFFDLAGFFAAWFFLLHVIGIKHPSLRIRDRTVLGHPPSKGPMNVSIYGRGTIDLTLIPLPYNGLP